MSPTAGARAPAAPPSKARRGPTTPRSTRAFHSAVPLRA
ncbi:Hypothetical protein CAP_8061 [Chondromyces apiculatus DSM 436]|uniref:Uncharacterized protein n=1 Tax=Chondromyces apiculatus DSM 436 TaxID=1192034 RepID=A0A017SY18_9BACT|nr:Hypothetical protein CAP_8061 [Chondromyces apiculatus DSM 436]